ncbi:dTMP kinase [Ornithinicoccus halotolerans]|uniref:dTMP kinase n=1 Tax=Ornithinicoccus halotolerans TaxID=1748220 RepID=UPI001E65228E|nr:dTMP kinase [Ornithinicoccus halotolerans]
MLPPLTAHAPPARGLFVAFEGGDGAGKSTQARLVAQALQGRGLRVVTTREPGGTTVGAAIREVLLHGEHVAPRAEALLFAADRAHHAATVVRPALAAGAVVLCDRFMDSSVAYQGAARGLAHAEVRQLSLWATEGLVPHLTVVLDVDAASAVARRGKEPDRLERESLDFHERVRAGFLALAEADPGRYLVLEATRPPRQLAEAVLAALEPQLAQVAADQGAAS